MEVGTKMMVMGDEGPFGLDSFEGWAGLVGTVVSSDVGVTHGAPEIVCLNMDSKTIPIFKGLDLDELSAETITINLYWDIDRLSYV